MGTPHREEMHLSPQDKQAIADFVEGIVDQRFDAKSAEWLAHARDFSIPHAFDEYIAAKTKELPLKARLKMFGMQAAVVVAAAGAGIVVGNQINKYLERRRQRRETVKLDEIDSTPTHPTYKLPRTNGSRPSTLSS